MSPGYSQGPVCSSHGPTRSLRRTGGLYRMPHQHRLERPAGIRSPRDEFPACGRTPAGAMRPVPPARRAEAGAGQCGFPIGSPQVRFLSPGRAWRPICLSRRHRLHSMPFGSSVEALNLRPRPGIHLCADGRPPKHEVRRLPHIQNQWGQEDDCVQRHSATMLRVPCRLCARRLIRTVFGRI